MQRPRRVVDSRHHGPRYLKGMWPETQALIGFGAVVGALIGIGTILWRAASWKGGVDEHRKGMDEHRKTVSDFMGEIRADIKRIFDRLPPVPAGVQTGSPLTLTDFGQEMSKNMGAANWAVEVAPTLQGDLVGKQAFEVDAFSRKYVYEQMREDPRVAKCMYEMGVERDNALNVLHVVLRDRLIAVLGISPTT